MTYSHVQGLKMNMLFGDGQPSRLEQAKLEVKMMNDMFSRMNATCFKKCAIKFHENDLNVGEMTCIDRCAGKYFEASQRCLIEVQNFEKQLVAQQQAMQQGPGQQQFR